MRSCVLNVVRLLMLLVSRWSVGMDVRGLMRLYVMVVVPLSLASHLMWL